MSMPHNQQGTSRLPGRPLGQPQSQGQDINVQGQLCFDEPMSRHTSWRVGGPADRFYQPAGSADLAHYLQQITATEAIYWVGLGSNLLVRDAGVRGTVICTAKALCAYEFMEPGLLRVEAGLPCPKVARLCVQASFPGAEFFAGIPGTIGGALAMNAGAFGSETWDVIKRVETMDRNGNIRIRDRGEFEVAYRHVQGLNGEIFVAAYIEPKAISGSSSQECLSALMARRSASQPIGQASCGSVFRNPPGDYAARLIEACELKGLSVGDAEVSKKHANFIINKGQASATDIERLINRVCGEVKRRFGVRLQREVLIIGDPC